MLNFFKAKRETSDYTKLFDEVYDKYKKTNDNNVVSLDVSLKEGDLLYRLQSANYADSYLLSVKPKGEKDYEALVSIHFTPKGEFASSKAGVDDFTTHKNLWSMYSKDKSDRHLDKKAVNAWVQELDIQSLCEKFKSKIDLDYSEKLESLNEFKKLKVKP